jgi:hypothetical protein
MTEWWPVDDGDVQGEPMTTCFVPSLRQKKTTFPEPKPSLIFQKRNVRSI